MLEYKSYIAYPSAGIHNAATKRNEQGRPTSSFRDILTSLSSLMRTRVRIEIPIRRKKYEETFYKTSEPGKHQKEIIRLLGVGRYL